MEKVIRLNDEIEELKEKVREYEKLIDELSAPIIASVVPDTLLIPLMGTLTVQRFNNIHGKILNNVSSLEADAVVVDFTGINLLDVNHLGLEELGFQIKQLRSSLDLMGVEVIFVGLSPELVRGIVNANIDIQKFNVQSTFRKALSSLLAQRGLDFISTKK